MQNFGAILMPCTTSPCHLDVGSANSDVLKKIHESGKVLIAIDVAIEPCCYKLVCEEL